MTWKTLRAARALIRRFSTRPADNLGLSPMSDDWLVQYQAHREKHGDGP